MTHGFNEAAKKQGGAGAEFDEIKRMLLETNPWFLSLTALVSILHVVYVIQFHHYSSHVVDVAIDLRCWPSSQMFRIGAKRRRWLECQLGENILHHARGLSPPDQIFSSLPELHVMIPLLFWEFYSREA